MQISNNILDEIKQRIETAIPDSKAEVLSGSERHYELNIISALFDGLSPVKQQQMVYATIKDLMSGNDAPIHAIDKMNLSSEDSISSES